MNETRESKDTAYWHERPKEHTEEKPDMTLPPHPKAPYIFGPLNSPPPAPPIRAMLVDDPSIPPTPEQNAITHKWIKEVLPKQSAVLITNPQKIHDPDCEVTRKGSTIFCTCPLPGGI